MKTLFKCENMILSAIQMQLLYQQVTQYNIISICDSMTA